MSVYICFSTNPKSWLSKLILWATRAKAPISHSFISTEMPYTLGSSLQREMTVGAEKHVSWIPLREFEKTNTIVGKFRVRGEPDRIAKMLQWLETDYWEADYDISGGLAIGVKNRLRALWTLVKRKWRASLSPKKVICTELVIRALMKAGYFRASTADPELTDAPSLCCIVAKHYADFELVFVTEDVLKLITSC